MRTMQEIAKDIMDSNLSLAELSSLFEIIREKKKMVDRLEVTLKAMTLKSGQKVRLFGLSPKYLNGLEGEVVSVNNTRARVKLFNIEGSLRLRRFGGTPTIPIACLEVL